MWKAWTTSHGLPLVTRFRRPLSAKFGLWSAEEQGDEPLNESLSNNSTAESSRNRKSISSSYKYSSRDSMYSEVGRLHITNESCCITSQMNDLNNTCSKVVAFFWFDYLKNYTWQRRRILVDFVGGSGSDFVEVVIRPRNHWRWPLCKEENDGLVVVSEVVEMMDVHCCQWHNQLIRISCELQHSSGSTMEAAWVCYSSIPVEPGPDLHRQ